jgi:hypothetical protein
LFDFVGMPFGLVLIGTGSKYQSKTVVMILMKCGLGILVLVSAQYQHQPMAKLERRWITNQEIEGSTNIMDRIITVEMVSSLEMKLDTILMAINLVIT